MHPAQHERSSAHDLAQRRRYRRGRLPAQIKASILCQGLLSLGLLVACQAASSARPVEAELPTAMRRAVTFETPEGSRRFLLEQALTPAAQAQGLMFRRSLTPAGGMIFVFDHDAPRQFWMKNTYIPLDMIFVDRALHVVGIIDSAEPQSLTERGPKAPCRYVIELAGGTARRLGITPGTLVRIDPKPSEAP